MITIQLIYGEISVRTIANHRLPGYSRIYLNKGAEITTYLTSFIGLTGALLAYIIVGGGFLTNLLGPWFGGDVVLYSSIFFILGALVVYFGTGPVSKTEFFSLGLFFAILAFLFFKSLPHINPAYFTTVNLDLKNFFLPYGVILFSLSGLAVVPEMKEILKEKEASLKKLIIIGTIIPIITYLLFIVTIFGVTGPDTTQKGMDGLNLTLGSGIVQIGFMFGVITTFTSFLTLGITLKKTFHYDLDLPAWLGWILACFPAFILFLLGFREFIGIIGFIGAVTLGIDIIIISLIYLKAKKKSQRIPAYTINIPKWGVYLLIALFLVGVAMQFVKF